MPILTTSALYDRYSTDLIATQPVTRDIPFSIDTMLQSNNPTTNYVSNVALNIGKNNAAAQISRAWGKPDFSTIPTGATFISSIFHPTPIGDFTSNVRTMRMHRCLRAVVGAQATWNIWSTGNNWGTAGCSNSSNDYDGAVELGNMSVPAAPTLNVPMSMTVLATEFQKLFDGTYTNNGIVLFMDTQIDDLTQYASQDNTTPAYRPYFTVTYMPR